jgi:glycosyltransferase involved in cell wall biosynthesis
MGGVESILRHHWEHDASYGIQSQFISYLETGAPAVERVAFLGASENTTTNQLRQIFAAAIAQQKPQICVYHGTWLVKYFADLDLGERRILQLHGAHTTFGDLNREVEPWADGLAGVSRLQYDGFLNALPNFSRERTELLFSPIFPPSTPPSHPPLQNRRMIIGYCGRLADDAKRLDRAPACVEALEKSGFDYGFEFLGEGPLESELKEQFRSNARVVFHGRKAGPAYWDAIRNWDFFVLFSDTEGTPLSILETMSQGVLPLMPGINSGADYYAGKLGPEFIYPPYDFTGACATIRRTAARPEAEIQSLRRRAAELVNSHCASNYFTAFAKFLGRIQSMPRRSSQVPILPPMPLRNVKLQRLAFMRKIQQRLRAALRQNAQASLGKNSASR